ncbi:restriction endonuclease subunit M [Erysipelothrix rhusiopathiae]|uniref:restriction endonuclease subunit M n=1 Tax=Erysipelothrix rhusiopathiae TaxID=1648 RepID=UPI00202B3F7A|nr:restriction endonuclease subunit M [Erysipelothrix rhusiopathiae]URQ76882.1 restriction endonuclease subunit M [Erysipelothrix rhusiopathiae]
MGKNISIGILNDKIMSFGDSLLKVLLKDRTTNKNIVWASKDYEFLGLPYLEFKEITIELISSKDIKFIKPRVLKSFEKQEIRTRDKGEVFTPSWVCNLQNNKIDEMWFNKKNVFNKTSNKGWDTNYSKIEFCDCLDKTWKDYVRNRRLEISCGEAPYLVSRYDTVSGKPIDVKDRIGLLDRKIRVINENIDEKNQWVRWVVIAYQSIYGYEIQGDNLLLARENLLLTFIENMEYKFGTKPNLKELNKIAFIISWNIWQMDGLNYTVPNQSSDKKHQQLSLFEEEFIDTENNNKIYCKIKNWEENKTIEFRSLMEDKR